MIDEKKIKRELKALLETDELEPIQEKLLKGFVEYISKQPVANVREAYFRQRMIWWLKAAGANVLVEVE